MNLLTPVDNLINGITMYRLVTYVLSLLVGVGVLFSAVGILSLSWLGMLENLAILSIVCFSFNQLLARLFHAVPNFESSIITTLILTCILPPSSGLRQVLLVGLAGAVAMISKYIVAIHRKHIFNPAAFGAVVLGISGLLTATWWIGSPSMLPFTLILGLLIVRKLRRFSMVLGFAAVAVVIITAIGVSHGGAIGSTAAFAFTSWPLVFLGTIMLTEPSTTPPRLWSQVLYGLIVGAIFASGQHIGTISATPEVALVLGNVFAALVSPFAQFKLRLKEKHQLSDQVYEYVFTPDRPLRFLPGQYMEWTLPLGLLVDSRGNRRTFTIASSPTEPDVHLGVKFYQPASSFKGALTSMKPGQELMAGHISGSFTLPPDEKAKMVFIAGGIGITPFRSMLKYLIDSKQTRDIVLIQLIADPSETSFQEVLAEAKQHGVKVVTIPAKTKPSDTWNGREGHLTDEIIKQEIPDYAERLFYASGPPGLVRFARKLLRGMGVSSRQIKTDFFSGY